MTIDPYAPCPCGSGKKVKFCDSDLLSEFEKIQKMLDGNQRHAALDHVDKLLAQHPNRAALLAIKLSIAQELGMEEVMKSTIAQFIAAHPTNPVALAHHALLVIGEQGAKAGVEQLQLALANSGEMLAPQVVGAIGAVAQMLLMEGRFMAAHGHLLLSLRLDPQDNETLSLLARLNGSPQMPLLMKEELPFLEAPVDAPWRAEFSAAMHFANSVQWLEAEKRLTTLAARIGNAPAIWQNLAVLRGWLAEDEKAVEALRKLSALQGQREEAVESEALAQLIDPALAADVVDHLEVVYTITNLDQFIAACDADRRLLRVPVESFQREAGEVPPRAGYMLLDREQPSTGVEITIDAIPNIIGRMLLFGRETDKEPRVEVDVNRQNLDAVKALLADVGRDALGPAGEETVVDQIPAASLVFSWNWRLPDDTPPDHVQQLLVRKRRDTILNRWPKTPKLLFGGKTPEEVASDPAQRVKLLAAILLVELSLEHSSAEGFINELRARLGLPTLQPIDPTGVDLQRLPLPRLTRVMVDKLSDDDLLVMYRRALFSGARTALRKFAAAVVERPSLKDKADIAAAWSNLSTLEEDPNKALEYIGKARAAAAAAGKSCARWDITELAMRLERGDDRGSGELLQHIETKHANEPGVGQALMQMLYQAGLIGPDGRPRGLPPGAGQATAPGIVVPGSSSAAAAQESSGIWTPGSEAAAAGKKSALWTPD
jgi:tetratricopeptide (TPR) repeat protein